MRGRPRGDAHEDDVTRAPTDLHGLALLPRPPVRLAKLFRRQEIVLLVEAWVDQLVGSSPVGRAAAVGPHVAQVGHAADLERVRVEVWAETVGRLSPREDAVCKPNRLSNQWSPRSVGGGGGGRTDAAVAARAHHLAAHEGFHLREHHRVPRGRIEKGLGGLQGRVGAARARGVGARAEAVEAPLAVAVESVRAAPAVRLGSRRLPALADVD